MTASSASKGSRGSKRLKPETVGTGQREVWFRLIHADGAAVAGYGPTFVSADVEPSLNLLAFFRYVLSIEQYKRRLPGVRAEQLRLYADRDAFERAREAAAASPKAGDSGAAKKKGKQKKRPLPEDYELKFSDSLSGLGATEQTAMWVVVPAIRGVLCTETLYSINIPFEHLFLYLFVFVL